MHQYQLQRYSGPHSKHRCPHCQHRRKTFTVYINTQTNQPLASHVGKCDREVKCGYHYKPKQYFADEGLGVQGSVMVSASNHSAQAGPLSFNKLRMTAAHDTIPTTIFTRSLSQYGQNNLIEYLTLRFGYDTTLMLIERYFIGTSKHWYGATVFWQVDVTGQVRAGKIMLYNVTNAKRVKQPFNHITWVHTLLQLPGFELSQCFFGEHLLQGNNQPVAIVESEKTALIASVCVPAYIWLAAGSLNNLTPQKCTVLTGRQVYLYPDLGAYEAWQAKVKQLAQIATFKVFYTLEDVATDTHRAEGLDIADYLMGVWPV